MLRSINRIVLFLICIFYLTSLSVPGQTQDFVNRSLCVYSPIGKSGPITNMMNKYKIAAMRWGVRLNLEMYSDELNAYDDFKKGQCDAVLLGDVRTRKLVKFGGGISQVGAIPTFKHLRKTVASYGNPEAGQYLRSNKYEVVYFFPIGRVYLFFGDELMQSTSGELTLKDLQGEKFGILGYDEQSRAVAKRLGTEVVESKISTLFEKFNTGKVDIIYSTPSAYKPLELYKGLGEAGRIMREPVLAMMSFNVTIHHDRFPDKFGQKSRNYSVKQFEFAKRVDLSYRSKVPAEYWMKAPKALKSKVKDTLKEVRTNLTEEGIYDKRLTKMLKKIRCSISSKREECP